MIEPAIGSIPAAVSYANIVLYDMEHPIIERLRTSFYRSNAINSCIQLEDVMIGDTDCVFLDLAFPLHRITQTLSETHHTCSTVPPTSCFIFQLYHTGA